jgi:hypothetical protein
VAAHAFGVAPVQWEPVKNFAVMQPPRQASKGPQDAHAPALWVSRSDANKDDERHTASNPPGSRTLPASRQSMTKGHS